VAVTLILPMPVFSPAIKVNSVSFSPAPPVRIVFVVSIKLINSFPSALIVTSGILSFPVKRVTGSEAFSPGLITRGAVTRTISGSLTNTGFSAEP